MASANKNKSKIQETLFSTNNFSSFRKHGSDSVPFSATSISLSKGNSNGGGGGGGGGGCCCCCCCCCCGSGSAAHEEIGK
ncbi:hypothetical protein [Enterococcus rotai]|uniref:hypothetical protein n=1 Tax=Enterococcus rotai TaxID=118060 RepID=UPI0032B47140